jgi:hypothetical protein
MINYSHYQIEHEEVNRLLELVKMTLFNFAMHNWGSTDQWSFAIEPKYINSTANRQYPWLGVVFPKDFDPRSSILTANDRYCITLHELRYFRIILFRDYGYNIIETSTSYLCTTKIVAQTALTNESLRSGLQNVFQYLQQNPVSITFKGHDHPTVLDAKRELAPGIEFSTQVLNKHS